MLLKFPHHDRASAVSRPKTSGLAALPTERSASAKIMDFSGGIRPRERQLLTPGGEIPASCEALNVPPTASRTSSTVSSSGPSGVSRMLHSTSRFVNSSSLHTMPIVTGREFPPNSPMAADDRDAIVKRLRTLPDAFGINAAELCRRIDCAPNAWSQYTDLDGKRIITRAVASRVADEFNLTLDWIYRGKSGLISAEVLQKLRKAA